MLKRSWRLTPKQDHLVCFLGGSLMLGATRTGVVTDRVSVPPSTRRTLGDGKARLADRRRVGQDLHEYTRHCNVSSACHQVPSMNINDYLVDSPLRSYISEWQATVWTLSPMLHLTGTSKAHRKCPYVNTYAADLIFISALANFRPTTRGICYALKPSSRCSLHIA